MKKIMMFVVCLAMMGIQTVSAQVAIAALHHEGNVTIYSSAQVAVDNSLDGDTIYLSEGMFGGFIINKEIAVIGSGMKTSVSPDITITGDDVNGVTLSNLSVVRNIQFGAQASPTNVKIRQCKIAGDCRLYGSHATNIEILMCYIKGVVELEETTTDNLAVINSKIGVVRYGGKSDGSAAFVNCNIGETGNYESDRRNNYVNCIINTIYYGSYQNCLYSLLYSDPHLSDCYNFDYYNYGFSLNDNLDCTWTDEQLSESGYFGTDGTVVGITGGANPYTLASPVLRITEHNIEVDNEQRKLKVTLTLGTEE